MAGRANHLDALRDPGNGTEPIPKGSQRLGTQDMRRCSGVGVPYGLGIGAGSEGKGFPARDGLKEAVVTDAT